MSVGRLAVAGFGVFPTVIQAVYSVPASSVAVHLSAMSPFTPPELYRLPDLVRRARAS